jgi:hypothetical protein
MEIRILRSPGLYGGVIMGRLDGEFDPSSQAIAICQKSGAIWTSRQLDVPAARLWSADLGENRKLRVHKWMAVLVTKGFDPCDAPRNSDYIFATTEEDSSFLFAAVSDAAIDPDSPRRLGGIASSKLSPSVFFDKLFPYAWDPRPDENGHLGWRCLGSEPIERTPETSDRWSVDVRGGVQYAVLQFGARSARPPCFTHGTLPVEGAGATAITSPIGIHILSNQYGRLTGVVTGLACANETAKKLTSETAPEVDGRLHVVLWVHGQGRRKPPLHVLCEPSGYWTFDKLPQKRRTTLSYSVAVTTLNFKPGELVPDVGGEVIAVRKSLR